MRLVSNWDAPRQLGWQKKRFDALVGYGLFIPTGKFTAGASNNHGLGMWSHELSAGTTVYLDKKKQWHAATNAYYNIQSHIRHQPYGRQCAVTRRRRRPNLLLRSLQCLW